MTITRPVLRYFGGKWKLAPWIISNMPEHKVYVEPCGGAASVLMRKVPAPKLEVYNEILAEVTNVFKVIRSAELSQQLERLCKLTPFSYEAYLEAWDQNEADPVESARKTLVRSFFSYSGLSSDRKPGMRMLHTKYQSGNHRNCARDWSNHNDHLQIFSDRLKGVMISSKPALETIAQYDHEDVLIYLDPPYSMHNRTSDIRYEHDWNDQDHIDMVDVVSRSKSMIMLSGYQCPFYERLEHEGWVMRSSRSWTSGLNGRDEFLWVNPAAQRSMPQPELELVP